MVYLRKLFGGWRGKVLEFVYFLGLFFFLGIVIKSLFRVFRGCWVGLVEGVGL